MALSVSRSTAEVAGRVLHQQRGIILIKTIRGNKYLHQGLIFSICAAVPLQSKVAGTGQQTVKTPLHVHEHLTSLEAIPRNFLNVPNLLN